MLEEDDVILEIIACMKTDEGQNIAQTLHDMGSKLDVMNKLLYKLINVVAEKNK